MGNKIVSTNTKNDIIYKSQHELQVKNQHVPKFFHPNCQSIGQPFLFIEYNHLSPHPKKKLSLYYPLVSSHHVCADLW